MSNKSSTAVPPNIGNNTASMKSIESSMIALSVSLSSYLTVNKPEGMEAKIEEEEEPQVRAVVIRATSSHEAKNITNAQESNIIEKTAKQRDIKRVKKHSR